MLHSPQHTCPLRARRAHRTAGLPTASPNGADPQRPDTAFFSIVSAKEAQVRWARQGVSLDGFVVFRFVWNRSMMSVLSCSAWEMVMLKSFSL